MTGRMTEILSRKVGDGQRDRIVDGVIDKIFGSHEYEEYIEDRIENVLSNLMEVPLPNENSPYDHDGEDKENSNYLKDGFKGLI